jgi:hypothetical protein
VVRRKGPLCAIAAVHLALALAGPAAAAGLTEAGVRAFLARQEAAWNARRVDDYFAGFTRDAMFVDQHVTPKEVIVYGRSNLAQARATARRFLKTARSTERSQVRSLRIAPSGTTARVLAWEVTTVTTGGRTRTVCANTDQTLVLAGGRILSKGQTDSIVRCPR